MTQSCEIIRELAEGGQKRVYLAKHPDGQLVVIKKGTIKSFTSLERIRREIDLLSELSSEFYPKQYHFNIDVKAKEFEIVEEYIEGKVLREVVNEFHCPKKIYTFLKYVVEGLSIIWEKNVVHRDLKPENIIIRSNGKPCIIDLGIARFLDMESLTRTISPVGPCTPIYASPEQLNNSKHLIDQRTDFFSLGIIALELYLGIHPFDPKVLDNNFSIVENIMQNQYVVATDDIEENNELTSFACKTLQTQPYQRFRTYEILSSFINKMVD